MKFQLTGADLLETHHIYGLIHNFMQDNHGKEPTYIILHPETSYRIQAQISQHDALLFSVIRYNYQQEKPKTTLYGITLIRSYDVEEDFIELV
jgi:hypothetical protein